MVGSNPSREGGVAGAEASTMRRYTRTVMSRWKLVAACVALTVAAAAAYVALAPRTYTAEAQLLTNPASTQDSVLFSLPVLHSTGNPTQDVLTASALIHTPAIAQATLAVLRWNITSAALLHRISTVPLDQSNIISLRATAHHAEEAQRLANTYAAQAVAVRTQELHRAIASLIPGLSSAVARLPPAQRHGSGTLGDQLTQLQQLQSTTDPTVSVAAQATLPTSPSSPRIALSLLAGLFAGLLIGIGVAFALGAMDPRIQREEQVHELVGDVPVLARVPHGRPSRAGRPLTPDDLTAGAFDQYRLMRAMLGARGGTSRCYALTGTGQADGKTTSAINLAVALAQSGARTVLIDVDLRRPAIGRAMGLTSGPWVEDVLTGAVALEHAVKEVTISSETVLVVPAYGDSSYRADRLSPGVAAELVEAAKRLADVVVIDTPPLTAVVEALPFATAADELLVAIRMGHSRTSSVRKLWELLGHRRIDADGILLIEVRDRADPSYHYQQLEPRERPHDVPDQPAVPADPTSA